MKKLKEKKTRKKEESKRKKEDGKRKRKEEKKKSSSHFICSLKDFQELRWKVCLKYSNSLLMVLKEKKRATDLMCVFQNPLILNPFNYKSGLLLQKLDTP